MSNILTDITVYVPSTRRHAKLAIFDAMPDKLKARCVLVCPEEEIAAYASVQGLGDCAIIAQPPHIKYIGALRQWCIEVCPTKYAFMMDDDLVFSRRKKGKLVKATSKDVWCMFNALYAALYSGIALVGVSARQGNNYGTTKYVEVGRMVPPLCMNVDAFRSLNLQVAPFPDFVMDDFHIVLSFLEAGYKNRILYNYAHNDKGSNSAGGCSTWRTAELQRKSAFVLAQLHPNSVAVKAKQSKTGWKGMQTLPNGEINRVDVVVGWARAYNAAKQPQVAKKRPTFLFKGE